MTKHHSASTARSRPDRLTLTGLGIVALAAAGTSFDALAGLAGLAGWTRDVRPALPVIVDTLAAVSTRAWLSSSAATDAKRFAKRAALASIGVSMVGNTLYHLIVSGVLRPSVALVIGVAMVPPLGLAAAAHLVAVLRPAEQTVTQPQGVADTAQPDMAPDLSMAEPVTVLATEPDTTADMPLDIAPDTTPAPKTPARRPDTAARVAKLAAKHPDASAAELARRLGVSDRTIRRHLAALAAA